ncbi:AAA family ATPase [Mollicutes bacterium LVI A0039]|nr:AAA family ATPase [Mollicutes bacterium LVI A0039]
MIINKLRIDNFRSYQEATTFVFEGDSNLNLILGENGSGKTSFLSAIKYVLFGPRTFGSDYYTKDYINWARNEVNFNSSKDSFEIHLEFTSNEKLYEVTRSSHFSPDYSENLTVLIDEQLQDDNSFLDNLSFNLFNNIFFNGENISTLTSSNHELGKFTEKLIDVYFELDVFKRIIKDTESAISKEIKAVSSDEYKKYEQQLSRINQKISSYEKSVSDINAEMVANETKIMQVNSDMKKRNLLSDKEAASAQKDLQHYKKQLADWNQRLVYFLKTDAHNILHFKTLLSFENELENTRAERSQEISRILNGLSSGETPDYNQLSIETEIKIVKSLNAVKALKSNSQEIFDVIVKVESANKQINKLQKRLAVSESGLKYIAFDTNLEFLNQQSTELKHNLELIETKLEKKLHEKQSVINKIEVEKKKMLENQLFENALNEKENLIAICQEYVASHSNKVFEQVALEMETILKQYLLRKSNLVDHIEIKDYKLIIKAGGSRRDINSFSSGEQQLILVGLIFAVLKVAEVKVPLILDTFFARIDESQQTNLINYINEHMLNQILFIATDSELTNDKINKFDNLNKIYKLNNDGYITTVKELDANKNN